MNKQLLEILRCPRSGQRLLLSEEEVSGSQVVKGWLVSEDGAYRYPIRNSIPRFVPESNYADNFGMQWNKFSRTQLDSHSGHPISATRFWNSTGGKPADIAGKWVLDVGCGAGRFSEVALQSGAKVVALDYSSAVDACQANLGHHENLHVVQGDVYSLPLVRSHFALVYCFGVLQHTPDVGRAFAALPPMVEDGGLLCVDFYQKSWKSLLLPKYWLRPLTTRIPTLRLFSILQAIVPKMLQVSRLVGRFPVVGRQLRRMVPVANYEGILPLDDRQQSEWSLLDTFDWLSPKCDHPQTAGTVLQWMHEAGLEGIQVHKAGHLVGRGTKPRVAKVP